MTSTTSLMLSTPSTTPAILCSMMYVGRPMVTHPWLLLTPEPEVDYYQTLRVFDLTSPEWSPALLLLACLRLMFPERDCVALVTLRNKLFDKYYK